MNSEIKKSWIKNPYAFSHFVENGIAIFSSETNQLYYKGNSGFSDLWKALSQPIAQSSFNQIPDIFKILVEYKFIIPADASGTQIELDPKNVSLKLEKFEEIKVDEYLAYAGNNGWPISDY